MADMSTSREGEGTYVCNLPKELQAKAKSELNENERDRPTKIRKLREKVNAHPGLKCPTSDLFLLRFLRARKFDVERSYQLLLNYYKIRAENDEVMANMKPSTITHVLDDGVSILLPMRDKHGRRMLMIRPGKWDPDKYSQYDILRANVMALEKVVMEEETQINGFVMVGDFSGLGLSHVRHFERNYAKIMFSLFQEAFPMRFKGMHMYNEAFAMTYIFPIVKMFMKEKIAKRLHMHGTNIKSIQKEFGAAILPENLGGLLGNPDELAQQWKKTLLSNEEVFEEMTSYHLEIPRQIIKHKNEEKTDEVVGTFKKLNVD